MTADDSAIAPRDVSRPMSGVKRTAGWLLLYMGVCLTPLGVALSGPLPPGRSFFIELGVMFGFVGFGMMASQFLLTARFAVISRVAGQDLLLQFHRLVGIAAGIFIAAHVIVLLAAEPEFRSFFDPRVNLPRAAALSMVSAALLVIIGSSMLRARLAVKYEWWRLTHGLLAVLIMVIGAAHIVMVGHYADAAVRSAAFIIFAIAPVAVLGWVRVARPLHSARRQKWTLVDLREEIPARDGHPATWVITLRPDVPGRFRFVPGQFVWLTFASHPLSLEQHPFTIASSAERPDELEFAIKELGDFTRTVGSLQVGSPLFIEGPAGGLVPPDDAQHLLLIAGGIGITPMMSVLRTLADRNDRRRCTLIYAYSSPDRAAFRTALSDLEQRMPLRVLHLPEAPLQGWTGRTGYVDAALLAEVLPPSARDQTCAMICGPPEMMRVCERLLLDLGVPRSRIRVEHFHVV